jgi:hypothetical protein
MQKSLNNLLIYQKNQETRKKQFKLNLQNQANQKI